MTKKESLMVRWTHIVGFCLIVVRLQNILKSTENERNDFLSKSSGGKEGGVGASDEDTDED